MAIIRLGNNRYQGLTADTKPTNVPAGAIYTDTQLDIIYEYNGSSWDIMMGNTKTETYTTKTIDSINNTVKNLGSFKYTIFKDGSTYYCRNNLTGAIEVSNSSPNTVLQFPLTAGGSVYVQEADYVLTGSPAVYFDFPVETLYCHFEMAPSARIMVPAASTSTIFRFKNGATHCTGNKLIGGFIRENTGSPSRLWTGILFEGSGNALKGVFGNVVDYVRIWDASIGIKFNCDNTSVSGFVTSNWVNNCQIYRCKDKFIYFGIDITYTQSPINGSHRNRITNMLLQNGDDSFTCVGVDNIFGRDNQFTGVYCADFAAGTQKSAVIAADSASTIIEGGTMTLINFEDNASDGSTKIRDGARYNQIGRITPGISGTNLDIVPVTGAVTNTTSWYNAAKSERLYIKKDATQVLFDIDRVLTGGSLRPMIFRQYDSFAAGTPIESFRMETDGGLRVFTDKLRLRDSNDTHNYNIKTSNITADRDITLPLLTANDIPVFESFAATLSSKNLTSTGFIDILRASTPATPATNHIKLYADNADTHFKYRDSTGDTFDMTALLGPIRGGGPKWGFGHFATATGGSGLFSGGFTQTGAGGVGVDTANGNYIAFTTGAVNGNGANHKYINNYTARILNPYLGIKFYIPTTAVNNRVHLGLKSNPSVVVIDDTDDPLAGVSGIMIVQRASASANTFEIATNDASTTTFTNTGVTVAANTIYIFELRAVTDTKFQWRINGSAWADVTATIPASTTTLGYYAGNQTDETGAHVMRLYAVEAWTDK